MVLKRQKITTKACIIGEPQSGKSTFANCGPVVRDSYLYGQSLGLNIFYHGPFVVELEEAVNVNLILWELTIGRDNQSLRRSYLRGASVIFIVCDVATPVPFSTVVADIEFARACVPKADIYIVASKLDLNPTYDFSAIEKLATKLDVIVVKAALNGSFETEPIYRNVVTRIAVQRAKSRNTAAQKPHLDPSL